MDKPTFDDLLDLLHDWMAWHYLRFGNTGPDDGAPISATADAIRDAIRLGEAI